FLEMTLNLFNFVPKIYLMQFPFWHKLPFTHDNFLLPFVACLTISVKHLLIVPLSPCFHSIVGVGSKPALFDRGTASPLLLSLLLPPIKKIQKKLYFTT
ncbi:hypothetical protein KKB18_10705, partial [bacterium]|nr:hypothetical protein [bacterium]